MNARIALVLVLTLSVIGMTLGPGRVDAETATPEASIGVLGPDAMVDGHSLAEWSARSWQWFFSVPMAVNPFADETGTACGVGQAGPVFFLSGADHNVERSCIV